MADTLETKTAASLPSDKKMDEEDLPQLPPRAKPSRVKPEGPHALPEKPASEESYLPQQFQSAMLKLGQMEGKLQNSEHTAKLIQFALVVTAVVLVCLLGIVMWVVYSSGIWRPDSPWRQLLFTPDGLNELITQAVIQSLSEQRDGLKTPKNEPATNAVPPAVPRAQAPEVAKPVEAAAAPPTVPAGVGLGVGLNQAPRPSMFSSLKLPG